LGAGKAVPARSELNEVGCLQAKRQSDRMSARKMTVIGGISVSSIKIKSQIGMSKVGSHNNGRKGTCS
jgi:hypothetical protein